MSGDPEIDDTELTKEERLQNLREFDLERINKQLRADGVENVEKLEAHFRRFVKVALENESDEGLQPQPHVDEYWHKLILDTQLYHDFCEQVFGRYFHHIPEIPDEEDINGESPS